MNLLAFTGNLGKDAEVKYLANGTPVCEFSVAMKSGYGDKEKTNWVRCALFGKRAEGQLPQYLLKGAQVAVTGELELQEWEGQNGKGAALSVRVESIDLIGGKPQAQNNQSQGGYAPQQQSQNNYQQQAPQQSQYQGGQQQGGGYGQQQQQQSNGYNPNQGGYNSPQQ